MRRAFGPNEHLDLVCDWTQDPDALYAFESSAGAAWWAEHGGPKALCKVLQARKTHTERAPIPVARPQAPTCFACDTPLCDTLLEPVETIVVKCGCRSKIIHTKCADMFERTVCVFCDMKYSMCTQKGRLLDTCIP